MRVLKGTHLPATVKQRQVRYLISSFFQDLYLYLTQNKLPSTKSGIQKVETLAEKIYLIRSLIIQTCNHT